jgi:hypothetical protein
MGKATQRHRAFFLLVTAFFVFSQGCAPAKPSRQAAPTGNGKSAAARPVQPIINFEDPEIPETEPEASFHTPGLPETPPELEAPPEDTNNSAPPADANNTAPSPFAQGPVAPSLPTTNDDTTSNSGKDDQPAEPVENPSSGQDAPSRPQATPTPPSPAPGTPRPAPQGSTTPKSPRKENPSPRGPRFEIPPANQEVAIAKASVRCEKQDADHCPTAVGMLLIKSGSWIGQCTAFLIGERLLMTNSHCIPAAMKSSGAECRSADQHLQVFFPQTQEAPAERASCERILTYSTLVGTPGQKSYVLNPDYALIQLNRPLKRQPFGVSRLGLPDGKKLVAYTVDPTASTSIDGILRTKICLPRQGSLVTPAFVHDFAPVASADSCKIIPGNSGSPVVDSRRQVRGLIHATLEGEFTHIPEALKAGQFVRLGVMTNLACTKLPSTAGDLAANPHEDCGRPADFDNVLKFALERVGDQPLMDAAGAWAKSAPKQLQFNVRHIEGRNSSLPILSADIDCVRDPKLWDAGAAGSSVSKRKSNGQVELQFSLPTYTYQSGRDPAYRVALSPTVFEQIDVTLAFDANDLARTGQVRAAISKRLRSSGQLQLQANVTLNRCKS